MTNVSELLRQADPLSGDMDRLQEAHEQMRRTVVAAASAVRPPSGHLVPRRRAMLVVGGVVTALVGGVLVGFGNRGALQAAVRFEVRLAETQPVPGLIVARGAGRNIYLHPELIVTNDDIAQSWITEDGPDRFGVSVQFLQAGAQRMRQATTAHFGRPVAILIDGEVVAAPMVRSAIGDSAVISGDFTRTEAERIANGIGVR
jgi:hypothetical protein